MFPSSGIQALRSYTSQARTGEILSNKRNLPDLRPLSGVDNVEISGRSKAMAFAKSFTARLSQASSQASQSTDVSTSQAFGANLQASANIQESILARKKERAAAESLPQHASLGFSSMSQKFIDAADREIQRAKEPPPDKYKTRISIDDFSLKFIRVLNPIPVQ